MDSERMMEKQVQRVPPSLLVGLALGSMVASAGFALFGRTKIANFIGQWVPSLLVLATFDRLVQHTASDTSRQQGRSKLPKGVVGTSAGVGSNLGTGTTAGSTRTPGL
jgi:hypothetical protein